MKKPNNKLIGGVVLGLTALVATALLVFKKSDSTGSGSSTSSDPTTTLKTFDVSYIGEGSSSETDGNILDPDITQIRIMPPYPDALFPQGTQIVLSGTKTEFDGTYDLFKDSRGLAGDGKPGNPPACWLMCIGPKTPMTTIQTPGAKAII